MKKNAILIGSRQTATLDPFDQALLALGFATIRVASVREALFRVENELFSVIVCEDSPDGTIQRELAAGLETRPLGITTPVVLLGNTPQPAERGVLTSLLDQYFPLHTDPVIVAEFVNETHSLRIDKAKRGRLGLVSVPRLLSQAARVRLSGAVVVEGGVEKNIVYFENGLVTFASSNRDDNRFGEFLVAQRIISREQFFHAVKILQQTKKRLGRILVEEGFLKPQVLTTLIQSQVKHIIFSAFDWRGGEFCILPDEVSCQNEAIARFDVAPLILEGVRFKFTEDQLNQEFQPFDAKVSLAMSLADCQKRMHLGKSETDFLRLIGAGVPIVEALSFRSFSRLESLKLLYSFRVLGLLVFEAGAGRSPQIAARTVDRSQVLSELFKPKVHESRNELASTEAALLASVRMLDTERARPRRKVSYLFGVVSGAAGLAALSTILWLANFMEPRYSDEGQTKEIRSIPATVAETIAPKPTPAPTKTPEPEAASAFVSPVPLVTPKVKPEKSLSDDEYSMALARAEKRRLAGRLDLAVVELEKAHRLRPQSETTTLALADALFDLNRLAEAENLYRQVLAANPASPAGHLALGTVYLMRDESEKAMGHYKRYLSLVPRTAANAPRITEVQKILKNLESR